jgi:hypothetical protein
MSRPRLLCLMHLPPPVHGVTVANQRVAASAAVAERLELDVVPLRFAGAVDQLGRISAAKLARAAATGLSLAARLAVRRPDAMYLTMSPHGGALLRDCAYAALARLAGVPRIYHLHARGIGDALATGWRRRLGTAGRARYADRFTFEAFERRLVDALTQIIRRGGEGDS